MRERDRHRYSRNGNVFSGNYDFARARSARQTGRLIFRSAERRKGQSGKDHSTFQVRLERNCWPERSSVSGAAGGRGTNAKKSVDAGERSRRRRLSFFLFLVQQHRGMGASNFHAFLFPISHSSKRNDDQSK